MNMYIAARADRMDSVIRFGTQLRSMSRLLDRGADPPQRRAAPGSVDVKFHKPTFFETLLFGKALVAVVAMLYGVRMVIENGSLTNEPELFRETMFLMFSIVLPLKLCHMLCWRGNDWSTRCAMFLVFYIPIGFALAKLCGAA